MSNREMRENVLSLQAAATSCCVVCYHFEILYLDELKPGIWQCGSHLTARPVHRLQTARGVLVT